MAVCLAAIDSSLVFEHTLMADHGGCAAHFVTLVTAVDQTSCHSSIDLTAGAIGEIPEVFFVLFAAFHISAREHILLKEYFVE
jgi:hypothetical protein